jgi:sugar/nucleoside kinase (ribokinase family)
MRLLVVGEALVEFMRPERELPLDRPGPMVGPFPSGAPAIFASVAARLGVPTALCAVVGDDPFGDLILERLARDGVETEAVRVDPGHTTATAFVAYTSAGERTFVFHVRHAAAAVLNPSDLGDLPERAAWLHVSGSTLALGEGMAATAVEAARRVRAAGGRLGVDPNVRPEAASAETLAAVRDLVGAADVVFPSEGELAALGVDEDELVAGGTIVCTTRGSAGASVRAADMSVEVPAPPVREVDPTGAGDTFAAGFTAATLLGADPEDAAIVACRLAARSVETLGPMEAPVEPLQPRP